MVQVAPKIEEIAVLLVEDDVESRDLLEKLLVTNYPGLELHLADNGAAGLELFRQLKPEIVMTDIRLPVMNGIAMAREIRKIVPETIIIAVTSSRDSAHLLKAIETGIHHYVLKPVCHSELIELTDRILEKIALKRLVELQFERIRRREHQLSKAQSITHLGSWEWDMASGQSAWSDELYRILGLDPEAIQASYQSFLERIHPRDRKALARMVQQACENLQPVSSHYFRVVRPDGSTRTVRGQLEAVFDDAGKPVWMIGTCHDVTEQKWAEAALQASEQRFSKIFQATPDLLSITGLRDGRFFEVNEAFLRALGYRRSEVVGHTAQDLGIWADDRERIKVAQILGEQGRVRDIEVRFKTKAGQGMPGLVSAELVEINDNQCILNLFKDMSERKRFEEDRARLAAIVESSNDAIMATDTEGTITSWNAGAVQMYGYTAGEMRGRRLCFLCVPELRDGDLHRGRHSNQVTHFESVHARKDGKKINVSLTMSPIRDAGGEIVGTSCIARDVTERAEMEQIIKHQAQHDTLTGLPNRKLLLDFLALELAQSRRNQRHMAILFLDLDRFKQINDTLGHAAGDLLLQVVAQRLSRCIRESDTVARLGGDEFIVLLPDLAQGADVATVLCKIMEVFEAPFLLDNLEVNVTASVGISMFPEDGDSRDDLVQKADCAMYSAKESNGNTYRFYSGDINNRMADRQKMAQLLPKAAQKGELELVFQPQVRVDTGKIVGVEALLRWRHPENGLLLPCHFLTVAEETGAIVPIGEWVIRNACAQVKRWQDKGYNLALTVNLSNRQFHQANLPEMTARALAETGLDPHSLELDITEEAMMENLDFSISSMRRLTALGVSFSVNDFGTGVTSLKRIKQLPIGKLKIDRTLLQDILTDPNDMVVVNAVICMSHNLNIKVNAVGVESEEQLALIRTYGCDEMQGNLISKPLSAGDFEKLAANL